jgi:coenzyme F420-reducing hydrogenase beta subunit
MPDAQWTGVVSSIAISMLETRQVDAVACVASNEETWSNPNPILAQTTDEVLKGRGVKPSLAPSLNILDEVKNDPSIRRLLFCGVGCSVQALRSIENELGIEIFILGTNCVDNSPSPGAAAEFIEKGAKVFSDSVRGYEFMQDFRVHVKTEETYLTIPYFCLPGTIAESSIAKSCRSCFDYTNALADVVVGYMAAPLDGKSRMDESWQTVTVRNERGNQMVETAITQGRLEVGDIARGSGDHQQLAIATTKSDALVQAMVGGKVQENGMPLWLGNIMATVLRKVSAKGIAFARYSIDYHIVRNYFHVLNEWGEHRARSSTPQFALEIVDEYLEMDSTLKGYAAKLTSKH